MANSLGHRGGGGGGGTVYSGGGIQQLGSTDGGALAMVEQQANREQRAADFASAYSNDPIAHHIQMRQDYLAQNRREQQAANERLDARTRTPAVWNQTSESDLVEANSYITDADNRLARGEIDANTHAELVGQASVWSDRLQKQKEAVTNKQKQQALQTQVEGDAVNRARNDNDARHLAQFGYRAIPDVIAPDYRYDDHGKKYLANPEEYKASVQDKKDAQLYNHQIDVVRIKQEEAVAKHKADMAAKAQEAERKVEENFLHHFKEAARNFDKVEDEFMAGNGLVQKKEAGGDGTVARRERRTAKERAESIGDYLEAMDLPRSLREFRAQRKGGFGSQPGDRDSGDPGLSTQMGAAKLGPGEAPLPPGSADLKKPDLSTAEGQLRALDERLGIIANLSPVPAPRKTRNPPGAQFSDQAMAEGSGFIFMP